MINTQIRTSQDGQWPVSNPAPPEWKTNVYKMNYRRAVTHAEEIAKDVSSKILNNNLKAEYLHISL